MPLVQKREDLEARRTETKHEKQEDGAICDEIEGRLVNNSTRATGKVDLTP